MIPKCRVCNSPLTRNEIERFKDLCFDHHVRDWSKRIRAKIAQQRKGVRDADKVVERHSVQADL